VYNPLDTLVERFLQRAGTLYSLPAVAVKVLQLADDPHLDTPRLKECIENDPALTSRILRVINSSLFGLSTPVADLGQALTLLGVKPLKLLVLGFSLPEGLYAGVSADLLQWYWRRTLTKAVSARELCQTLWRKPGDDAFLIGLLQDLGMLLLIQSVGPAYQDFVQRVRSMGKDLIGLERQVMGFDHTALTARLLKHWRLPEAIIQWISWEEIDHRLQASGGQPPVLAQVIHLAEELARVLADRQSECLNEVLRCGATYRGLTHSQLEQLVADMESKVAQLAEVLHLDLPPTEDYRAILLEAHRRLSEAAAEVVQSLLRRKSSASPAEETPEPLQPHLTQLSEAIERLSMPMGKGKKSAPVLASAREKEEAESEKSSIPEKGAQKSPSPMSALAEMLAPDVGEPGKNQPGADFVGRTTTPAKTASRSFPAAPSMDGLQGSRRLGKSASGARPKATISPTLSDPGLLGHLKVTVAACRNARVPVSLLLAEPVQQEDLLLQYGQEGMERFRHLLQKAAETLGHDGSILLPYGDWGVAVVLPDCDRQEAVRLGNQLLAAMRQVSWGGIWNSRGGMALGIGIASVDMPPKNFPAEDLLEAAGRCLFGSHSCGGGVVKSIEIY